MTAARKRSDAVDAAFTSWIAAHKSCRSIDIWCAAVEWAVGEYDKIPCTCGAAPLKNMAHDIGCSRSFARTIAAAIRKGE